LIGTPNIPSSHPSNRDLARNFNAVSYPVRSDSIATALQSFIDFEPQRKHILTNSTTGDTPYYVLMSHNCRFGPSLLQSSIGAHCLPIYGFSSKETYEVFRANCPLMLTPYPLVKRFLQEQIDAASDTPRLVVLNATRPDESRVEATTMESVLTAQTIQAAKVTTTYHLVLDADANAYRIETVPAMLP
jgi:hypothetical protein